MTCIRLPQSLVSPYKSCLACIADGSRPATAEGIEPRLVSLPELLLLLILNACPAAAPALLITCKALLALFMIPEAAATLIFYRPCPQQALCRRRSRWITAASPAAPEQPESPNHVPRHQEVFETALAACHARFTTSAAVSRHILDPLQVQAETAAPLKARKHLLQALLFHAASHDDARTVQAVMAFRQPPSTTQLGRMAAREALLAAGGPCLASLEVLLQQQCNDSYHARDLIFTARERPELLPAVALLLQYRPSPQIARESTSAIVSHLALTAFAGEYECPVEA